MATDKKVAKSHVLVIGRDPYRVLGPWDPKPVADAIQIGMAALVDLGFHPDACLVGLDGSDAVEDRIGLALQVGRWDCVIVGGGIGHSEEQLVLFESVINLIRLHAPQAAVAFNRTPHDLTDAVARVCSARSNTTFKPTLSKSRRCSSVEAVDQRRDMSSS